MIGLQLVFVPLVFVHLALSVYVFGFVRPARTLRVFHIYFGYAYLFLILASQTTHGENPQHVIFTVAMFICLAIHVGIGIFYAVRRREARVERTPAARRSTSHAPRHFGNNLRTTWPYRSTDGESCAKVRASPAVNAQELLCAPIPDLRSS